MVILIYRRPFWFRVLMCCFVLFMAFALLGGQYVHAEVVTSGLLLFAAADVLLAILSALGVAAVQNTDWYRTLQANFLRQCITLGLSVGGMVKAWLAGAKTWIDERLVSWVQGQLQSSGVGTVTQDLFDYFTPTVGQLYMAFPNGSTMPYFAPDTLYGNMNWYVQGFDNPNNADIYHLFSALPCGSAEWRSTWGRWGLTYTQNSTVQYTLQSSVDGDLHHTWSVYPTIQTVFTTTVPFVTSWNNRYLAQVIVYVQSSSDSRYVRLYEWLNADGAPAPGAVVDQYNRPVSTGASVCPTYYPDASTYQASDWYGGKTDVSSDGAADLPLTVADAASGAGVQDQAAAQSGATSDDKVAKGQGAVVAATNAQTIDDATPAVDSVTSSLFNRVKAAFDFNIFDKFPFSVPYDMYLFVTALTGSVGNAASGSTMAQTGPAGLVSTVTDGQTDFVPKIEYHKQYDFYGRTIPLDFVIDLSIFGELWKMIRILMGGFFLALLLSSHFHNSNTDTDGG